MMVVRKHAHTRGVWGHARPEKLCAVRSLLSCHVTEMYDITIQHVCGGAIHACC